MVETNGLRRIREGCRGSASVSNQKESAMAIKGIRIDGMKMAEVRLQAGISVSTQIAYCVETRAYRIRRRALWPSKESGSTA